MEVIEESTAQLSEKLHEELGMTCLPIHEFKKGKNNKIARKSTKIGRLIKIQ
jgi:hypothetical protein